MIKRRTYSLLTIILNHIKWPIMIVCICNHLNDNAVESALEAGARCPDTVQEHHGCAFNCGNCRETISDRIADRVEGAISAKTLVAAE